MLAILSPGITEQGYSILHSIEVHLAALNGGLKTRKRTAQAWKTL
jgi:hypothetical protein